MKPLKEMADELSTLTQCGGIRSYFDAGMCSEVCVYDSYKLFNFFCCCEEVAYAIEHGDYKHAEELIDLYKEDIYYEEKD